MDTTSRLAGLMDWIQRVRLALEGHLNLMTDEPGRFPGPGHYDRAARATLRFLNDRVAAQAVWLHGLTEAQIGLLPPELVGEDVLAAWQARRRIREWRGLQVARTGRTVRLPDGLIPDVAAVRGAVGLVLEQLDHWDPTGHWWQWTRGFQVSPRSPDPSWAANPRGFNHGNGLGFLRAVVAPLAELLGMWAHRQLARNVAEFADHATRVRRLATELTAPALAAQAEGFRAAVAEVVDGWPGGAGTAIWSWRQPGTLAAERAEAERGQDAEAGGPAEPREELQPLVAPRVDWGAVLIRVPPAASPGETRARLWQWLGRLHDEFPHRDGGFRDYLRRPGGYSALHTELVLGDALYAVPVRLVVEDEAVVPDMRVMVEALRGAMRPTVRVFTPAGDVRELPGGATVLNFALSIHNELAAHCKGAIINGQTHAGPLDVLSDGDRVEIVRAPELVPLPPGWRERVPPSTVHDVVRRLSRLHEAADVEAGRRAVRHHAARFDLDGIDAASIDLAVQRTVQARDWGGRGDALAVRQWLRRLAPQTGLKAEDRADLHLDPAHRERLLNQICAILEESVVEPTLQLPPELAERSWRFCQHCNSGAGDIRAIEVGEARLVIHESTKVSCAQGKVIPLAPRYQRRLRHWIVVETRGKQGIAGEVMDVFKHKGIDIQEVVARHTSLGRGLFRTEIRPIDRETEDALLVDLRAVGGVLDAYAVGEHQRELLSPELPPPRGRPTRAHGTAYVVGPSVFSDHHFYGRDGLVNDLLSALRPGSRAASGRGIYVFGPLRAGKTSLVLRAQYLLRRQDPMAVVSHLAADLPVNDFAGEEWASYEVRLRTQLADDLARWAEHAGGTMWPHADRPGLAGLVESVLEAADADRLPRIVLMIDEAVGLMAATERAGNWAGFLASVNRLQAQGVRLVWVGPPAKVCAGRTSGYVDFLKPCTQIRVGPFQTVDEVRDLLMARLADPYPPRTLGWKQARKIFELTGGEPGWVQALGRALEATAPARSSLIFDGPAVKRAVGQLVREDLLFYPRTAHAGSFGNWYGGVSGRDAWRALRAMARWRAQRPGLAVPLQALVEALDQPHDTVRTVMLALEEMGAVTASVESAQAWTFVASLLELYVARNIGVTHVD